MESANCERRAGRLGLKCLLLVGLGFIERPLMTLKHSKLPQRSVSSKRSQP